MIDLQLFKNIMAEARNNSTLLDSYSPNQFKAKEKIVDNVNQFVDTNSEIVILGGWYGSILVPFFKHVKRITIIDLDDTAISISKNRLFSHYNNIDYIASDVFDKKRHGRIMNADLIINPSCEHMPSMKTLDALKTSKAYFAFTSNNMYDIEGHTNCVSSIQEFKDQLPDNATVTVEDEIKDSRGIRYLIVGKLC
jgi:hypothetical protein|tara:strand:- start:149 stop:733 length:585 start_codon:yes stop_codon:yes gene_type:complete